MTVKHMCRVLIEEGIETRRKQTDQPRYTTERQSKRFKQIALRDQILRSNR